jgi:hypothetical protein
VGKLKGKRPLGHKRWWKGNIKMDFKEIWWWYKLISSAWGQRPVEGCCEHGNEVLDSIKYRKFLSSWGTAVSQEEFGFPELAKFHKVDVELYHSYFIFGRFPVRLSTRSPVNLTEIFHNFYRSLQENSVTIPSDLWRSVLFTFFVIHILSYLPIRRNITDTVAKRR